MADPNLTTGQRRPAFMNAGGEFPIAVPQSLGTISIEYRRFGTQIDFVPIVLGNGVIRLGKCGPRVGEIDESRSIDQQAASARVAGSRVPTRHAELKAGQTHGRRPGWCKNAATKPRVRGVPWLMDTPYLGTLLPPYERSAERNRTADHGHAATSGRTASTTRDPFCQIRPGPRDRGDDQSGRLPSCSSMVTSKPKPRQLSPAPLPTAASDFSAQRRLRHRAANGAHRCDDGSPPMGSVPPMIPSRGPELNTATQRRKTGRRTAGGG